MSKYPILFELDETQFNTHGIGVLSDATQCDVTEEINGVFELNMLYPSTGRHVKELKNNRIIFADASKELGQQPFRICRVTKMLNGLINVYAYHISYDLGGIQLPPFEADGIAEAFQKLKQYSTTENKFTFQTSMETEGIINLETPTSVRAYLMGAKNSVLQTYGGEFTFDRFNVFLSSARGSDKGFRVRYGVNMVDLNQEESIENTFTGIYPYYKDANQYTDMTVTYEPFKRPEIDVSDLPGKIMYAEGSFEHHKIASVNISKYFEEEGAPLSTDEVVEKAKVYMRENKIGIPRVSLDVRFESLRKSPEYANVSFMEDVSLGDTIHVDFVKLGVSSVGRINSIIYDSLKHKNKRVSIGDPKSNIADTFYTMENTVKESETKIAGLSKSVARVEVLSNQNSAKVELLVESNRDENYVKGSVLVEAINGQSSATISADKVNLTGYVTVNSLKAGGSTVIDGSRIQTGQITSAGYDDTYIVLEDQFYSVKTAGTYYFTLDNKYGHYFVFTISKNIPEYGSMRFYQSEMLIRTYNSDAQEIEASAVKETSNSSGTKLDVYASAHFSSSGTKIDLNSGEIKTPNLSIYSDGSAFFRGELSVLDGRIGPFEIAPLGLHTQFPPSSLYEDGYIGLYAGSFEFDSSITGESWVRVKMGDPMPSVLGGVQHEVKIYNQSEKAMVVTETDATLTGGWKATPYTDTTGNGLSEIVTKQDLISLGLITR